MKFWNFIVQNYHQNRELSSPQLNSQNFIPQAQCTSRQQNFIPKTSFQNLTMNILKLSKTHNCIFNFFPNSIISHQTRRSHISPQLSTPPITPSLHSKIFLFPKWPEFRGPIIIRVARWPTSIGLGLKSAKVETGEKWRESLPAIKRAESARSPRSKPRITGLSNAVPIAKFLPGLLTPGDWYFLSRAHRSRLRCK